MWGHIIFGLIFGVLGGIKEHTPKQGWDVNKRRQSPPNANQSGQQWGLGLIQPLLGLLPCSQPTLEEEDGDAPTGTNEEQATKTT